MSTLNLSTIVPDPEGIKSELIAYLSTKDSWRGLSNSAVGTTLLEMISAVGALDEAKIRRARQEAIPETAVSDRALYSLAVFQGVRLSRKLPASVTATLSTLTNTTIPAYTQFEGGGNFFFNRTTIFLTGSVPQSVVLQEGKVVTKTMRGLSEDFSVYLSAETFFTVSDVDVRVTVNSTLLQRATDGLYSLRGKQGFNDRTLPDGRMVVQFGGGLFGSTPRTTDGVSIVYVTTSGASANSITVSGKAIYSTPYPKVTGTFTSEPTGGSDQNSAIIYKNIAAPTFGTFGAAVTKGQYLSAALNYPGVLDAQLFAQRESNPSAYQWMNLIKIVLLTSTNWNAAMKKAFLQRMQESSQYTTRFFLEIPTPYLINVNASVYCYNWANTSTVQANVQAAITRLLQVRSGSLGYDFYLSDVETAIKQSDPAIEYFTLTSPTTNTIISSPPVEDLTGTVQPNSGALPPGFYVYGIEVVTALGIIAARTYFQVSTSAPTSSIALSWTAVPGALSYNVYGLNGTTPAMVLGLLANVPTNSYTDSGLITPGVQPLPQSTSSVRYAVLNSMSIEVKYSTRGTR